MIHLYTGKEITRDIRTACGVLLECLARSDASVPYQGREGVDCAVCRNTAQRIARMRGDDVGRELR